MSFGNSLERERIEEERVKLRTVFAGSDEWRVTLAVRWAAMMHSSAAAHATTAARYKGRFPREYEEMLAKEAECRAKADQLPDDLIEAQVTCHLAGFK